MKLNGKRNIITDRDVTITDNHNIGDSLHTVLKKQQFDIETLKSNVKWVFKYGGVGSGGGSVGPTAWSIVATLDGKGIQNNKITLNENISNYVLDIRISGASTSFSIEYSYGNESRTAVLSADNGWRLKTNIELLSNGHINITAFDGSLYKSVEATYITKPYIFSDIKFYRGDLESTWTSTSGDIFMETASIEGLILGCNYSFAINAESSYKWTFNNQVIEGDITSLTGTLTLTVPFELLKDYNNAGLYSAKLELFVTPEGQTERILEKTTSFNLIPEGLYLKILPANAGEQIYDKILQENYYEYSVNKNLGFQCRVYKGYNQNRDCIISYTTNSIDGDETTFGTINGYEGNVYLVTMNFKTEGWHEVAFSCTMEGQTKTWIKYLYCYKANTEYTWYKLNNWKLASSGGNIVESNYFRVLTSSDDFPITSRLDKTASDIDTVVSFGTPSTNEDLDEFAIHIGIQYNNINNDSNKIISFNGNSDNSIEIYQNNVTIGNPFIQASSHTCEWFIPKSYNYTAGDPTKFHLLSLVYTKVNYDSLTSSQHYQCCLYIDGVLEGGFKDFGTGSGWLKSVVFHPGNYSINLLDVTYFNSNNGALNDIDVNYYYYTYYSVKNNEAIDTTLTEIIEEFYNKDRNSTYSLTNDLIRVQSTLSNNIANRTSIPTLVLKRDRTIDISDGNKMLFVDWMNRGYAQDSKDASIYTHVPVELFWSNGNRNTQHVVIDKNKFGNNTTFYIQLQGSSTLGNKSKNFTLGIDTDVDASYSVLFSPNYKSDDNKTFLPEQMFTLKADVVDSSHTNNTAVGAFINNNNNFRYDNITSQPNVVKKEIADHVRQCLEGFPILLYLELTDSKGVYDTEYYYLGVYNFNLGRESYFNLGYCDLSQLDNLSDAGDLFSFTSVTSTNPLENFVAAEIQGNNRFWDFSQFDKSILFKQGEETTDFMFGDIVHSSNNILSKLWIEKFVENIAYSGGYLFGTINKTFVPVNKDNNDNYCYHTVDTVPDVKTQYVRTRDASGSVYTINNDLVITNDDLNISKLNSCILTSIDGETNIPYLNYDSVVYYYTTCMLFGLVDSVQKNLNIKTWNGKTFGLFFYDMDTSLGTSNSGGDTSYFCFSDYWDNTTQEIKDETGKIIETILTGVKIDRDYYPTNHEGIIGYDVPSSYLFAIAKYAATLQKETGYENLIFPQQIYATWRQKGNVLENADRFIDHYYASNLKDVPKCLLNLNYRNKFLYSQNGNGFSAEAIGLKGTKIEKTRNWLNGRLHILDAYFNLTKSLIPITENVSEPIHTVSGLENNPDIYILKDIFLDKTTNTKELTREGNCTFKVSAEAYAPLLVNKAGMINRYLLVNPNTVYTIKEVFSGQQSANFGGSDLWTSIENLNPFIDTLANKTGFYLNASKFEHISADSTSELTGTMNLITPSAHSLKLTGPKYSFGLSINDTFYNLTDIDISGSKISLNVQGSKVKNVNLNNISSQNINLENCNYLENVQLSNADINKLTITPVWTNNINLNNTKIKELIIQGKNANSSLTINNISTLTKVSFNQFERVNISGCYNITSITCNDSQPILKHVVITDCPTITSINLHAENLETLDLHECTNLEYITLRGIDFSKLQILNLEHTKVKYIEYVDLNSINTECLDLSKFTGLSRTTFSSSYMKLSNNASVKAIQFCNETDPVYLHYAIRDCANLERVYGNLKINCTYCFYNNRKFSIHGSVLSDVRWHNQSILDNKRVKLPSELLNIEFSDISMMQSGDNVTNLSLNITNASSLFAYTNCTIFDYYYFFTACTNVVNCSSTFGWTQNPEGVFQWSEDVDNSPNRHMFDRCANITTLDNCFRQSIITSPVIRIFTPIERDPIGEDGLFTKLTKLSTLTYTFADYKIYTDRFIFRKKEGNFNIEHITGLPVYLYVDDINELSYDKIQLDLNNTSTFTNAGNLSNIFNNLNNVKYLFNFPNTTYINYGDSLFTLPTSLQIMGNSFVSVYGKGEMKFTDYTANCKKNLRIINSSFRVTKNLSVLDMVFKVQLKLTNTTFENLSALEWIGFGRPEDEKWNANYTTSHYTESSFNGDGIEKIIDGEFPYSIFTNSGSKNIKHLSAIFMNATPANQYVNTPQLPGNMFKGLSNLKQTTALFFNINTPYNLSNSKDFVNFAPCQNLTDVSYMFGQSTYDDKGMQKEPMLFGPIPKKFFWHGENEQTVTIIGADNVTHEYDDNNQIISTNVEGDEEIEFTYKQPRATITNMEYCFTRCNCDAYINEDINNDMEPNPNYSPKAWILNNGEWEENNKVDLNEKTGIWYYDGNPEYMPEGEKLDETNLKMKAGIVIKEDTDASFAEISKNAAESAQSLHYIAPPDLLRYCISSANIKGLFAYSGVSGWNQQWNNANTHKYGYGIKGRICPYMLKPVNNTSNLDYLFASCKLISYVIDEDNAYFIPKDFFKYAPKVNSLKGFFTDMLLPQNIYLNVFDNLISLNITDMFYKCYWAGTANTPVLLSDVFKKVDVSATYRAFCIVEDVTSSIDRIRSQYITFNNMFKNKYTDNKYENDMNYAYTFAGYTDTVSHENPKTLPDNNKTCNYLIKN